MRSAPRRDHRLHGGRREEAKACGAELVSAVRTVAAGESVLDPHATRQLMKPVHDRKAEADLLSALVREECASWN